MKLHTGSILAGVVLVALVGGADLIAVPSLVSYQGQLTNSIGQVLPDSTYDVTFSLHTDSADATPIWAETAAVTTSSGLFGHLLGSVSPLATELWRGHDGLWLDIRVAGESISPRTRITSVPYAQVAAELEGRDAGDSIVVQARATEDLGGELYLHGPLGDSGIVLRGGLTGDTAAILPDSSISAAEMIDEAGFTLWTNVYTVDLVHLEMTDMAMVEIEIPVDGYIILDGKCYVELSGTTGPNQALVQIDETEGGPSQFPYYALVGLGAYVDATENYFPVYVTRAYYKTAGQYTFRMEGRASYPPPAQVRTWDHVLRATFLPTLYGFTSKVTTDPSGKEVIKVHRVSDPQNPGAGDTYYEVPLGPAQDIAD